MGRSPNFGTPLAFGLILAALVFGYFYDSAKTAQVQADQTIRVKGYAERTIQSDKATWKGTFRNNAYSLKQGSQALAIDRDLVRKRLMELGVDSTRIEFSSVDTRTHYKRDRNGYQTNQIAGYTLSQSITLEMKDIPMIRRISKETSDLIGRGVDLTSHDPKFFYSKLNDLKIEMMAEAAKNAKERASQLAENTGGSIGSPVYASQGVFQITAPNSTEVSGYGVHNTSSVEKTVKAVVTVEFAIE